MRTLAVVLFLFVAFGAIAAEEWVCPMPEHAKIYDKAGTCDVCGMALIPKSERDKAIRVSIDALAGKGDGSDLKPGKLPIVVAFVLTDGATMIDFAGPWEVFQDVYIGGAAESNAFKLITVSDSRNPIRTSGGMTVVPEFTFDDAPAPRVIVIPAQSGRSEKMLKWLRDQKQHVDVLASVCTGAFILGRAGLLDGKEATTHHDFYDALANDFGKVNVVRGKRYVQSDATIATAGGLSSGIDLALHIVQRYFGREIAERTADYMEYSGSGWK